MSTKKGASATALVGSIIIVIIFYILFLPGPARQDLLDDGLINNGGTGGTGGTGVGDGKDPTLEGTTVYVDVAPGRLDPGEKPLDKHLGSVYLFEKTTSDVISSLGSTHVSRSVFSENTGQLSFQLDNLDTVDNLFLTFQAPEHNGVLTVSLNGNAIFTQEMTGASPNPIPLNKNHLVRGSNTLSFTVNSPGLAFWETHTYSIENAQVVGDVSDYSRQESTLQFVLTDSEFVNLERAALQFIPHCANVREVGVLDVEVNGRRVFRGNPTCDDPYYVEMTPETLFRGQNDLTFRTEEGSYSIDQILVDLETEETQDVTYYFEMERELFEGYLEVVSEPKCGEIDDYCPKNCDEDRDIDCCFAESKNNYWCDIEPDEADDRCVSVVDENTCPRCDSGYEDYRGDPPDACEGLCGDDTDNECPIGCNIHYDEDCCFEDNSDNYWCEDLPVTGVGSTCEAALSSGECDDCPFGYKTETGDSIGTCDTGLRPIVVEEDDVLKDVYNVIVYIEFVDDGNRKRGELNVNGHITGFNQEEALYSYDISDWVHGGNNYISIFPITTLNIASLEVRLE